jgi:hypothetical protein
MPIAFDPILNKLVSRPPSDNQVKDTSVASNAGVGSTVIAATADITDRSSKWLVTVFYDDNPLITTDDASSVFEVSAQYINMAVKFTVANILSSDIEIGVDVVFNGSSYELQITNQTASEVIVEVTSLK